MGKLWFDIHHLLVSEHFGIFGFKRDFISGVGVGFDKLAIVGSEYFGLGWLMVLGVVIWFSLAECFVEELVGDEVCGIGLVGEPLLFIDDGFPVVEFLVHDGVEETHHFEDGEVLGFEDEKEELVVLAIV